MLERSMAGKRKSRVKANRALAAAPSPEDFKQFERLGVKFGIDPRAMGRLVTRLRKRPLSASGRLKLDDRELLALIDDRLALALEYLDDVVFGEANARDLATSIGILTDKRRLLREEPTAIVKFQDMRKLDEFLEDVSKELKRREKVIDVTPSPAATPVANAGNGGGP